jgi:hypothetical protein
MFYNKKAGNMRTIQFLTFISVFIAGICFTVYGQDKEVVVSGTVTDEAGNPISGVCVGFSGSCQMNTFYDTLWSLVDTVFTDSAGKFSKQILVNEYALGVRYIASKKGYGSQSGYGKIEGDRVDLGTVRLKSIGLKKVTVTGAVIDKAGNHVSQAMVLLSGGVIIDTVNLVNGPFDTAYTSNGGKFSKVIEVNNDVSRIVYVVGKKGFRTVRGFGDIVSIDNRVNIGTVTLFNAVNKQVTILGSVADSKTGSPVKDALVVVSSSSIVVIDVDSAHTNREGSFSITIDVENTSVIQPMVSYRVSKKGYFPFEGRTGVIKDTVSVGTIKLIETGVHIKYHHTLLTQAPDNIDVYSLQGRLLYSGKAIDNTRILFNRMSRQPVVILYKNKNLVLFKMKYIRM